MELLEVDLAEIVLATVNARYAHTAFGLRYLMANLGPLAKRAVLLELDGRKDAEALATEIASHGPALVGLGVYVWNVALMTGVAASLKRARPDLLLVLGGPEVSYETERQPIVGVADYVVTGEADLAFAELAGALLAGRRPAAKVMAAPLPSLDPGSGGVRLPYALYTDLDLERRVVYVEASRGCAFACDFCLSAIEPKVRRFPLPAFFEAMDGLLRRGAARFKFVDRTFNLDDRRATAVLEFFLMRLKPGLFLHFELVPDRLSPALRRLIGRFPPDVLHLVSMLPARQKTDTVRYVFCELVRMLRRKKGNFSKSGGRRLSSTFPCPIGAGAGTGTGTGWSPPLFEKLPKRV
jgi:radical SAM superfamily enzyme YgiQ (UPF0313 family)